MGFDLCPGDWLFLSKDISELLADRMVDGVLARIPGPNVAVGKPAVQSSGLDTPAPVKPGGRSILS